MGRHACIGRRKALGALGAAALLATQVGCTADAPEQRDTPVATEARTYWVYSPAGVRANGRSVDEDLAAAMEAQGLTWPSRAGESSLRVEPIYADDIDRYASWLFYERGWSDGLPLRAPTEQNVALMMRGTDLPREHVVATLAPLGGVATVEKIAVNAVMAGCAPCHLSVLIAAVEALTEPVFDLTGLSTTTSPNATMIIVNGPVARDVEANGKANALGRGNYTNAVVSRALHLIQQNVGGSWPGVSDLSTLGSPGDFCMMMAENDDENPWESLAVERGFSPDESVVTVLSPEGMALVVDIGVNGEGFLRRVAHSATCHELLQLDMLLVLAPATAHKLATEGWSKESIRAFVDEHARVPESYVQQARIGSLKKAGNEVADYGAPDEFGLVWLPFINRLHLAVAGGAGEKNELIALWSEPVSKTVALPKDWNDVLEVSKRYVEGA